MTACLHFPRGMVDRTVCTKAYIPYVLRIPSGRAWMDLGTDYGVYFFVILFRFHGVASPKSELRMTFYGRLCPVYSCLCVWMAQRYGQGMTTTIMYIIQLFIHKKTRLSTKVKNQMYNL